MRRRVLGLPTVRSAVAALVLTPVLVALPTVDLAAVARNPLAAPARAVASSVTSFAVGGVDEGAWDAAAPSAPTAMLRRPVALTATRATSRFDLVALTWSGEVAEGTTMSVRVREDGAWTPWHLLGVEDHGPDPGREGAPAAGEAEASTPLLTGGADGVQVKVDGGPATTPAGLRAVLVDGGRAASDAGSGPLATAAATTGRPAIVTRAQWGADESLVKQEPVVDPTVRTMFVHHTDTTNSYSRSQAYAQVRSIYAFHTKIRGWNDIGYNFVVDRYGRVFEGRRGSITAAVHGAHTGGFNTDAIGVSMLGTFTSSSPTSAATRGLVGLLAWKASEYFLNPRGSVVATSSGGGTTRYAAGTRVRLNVISGHRDVGFTECPGNALYPKLPSIRGAVAARMRPALTGAAVSPTVAGYGGGRVTFSASVPTHQKWTLTAVPICSRTPVATLSGRTTSRVRAVWDQTDRSGHPVAPGVYRVSVVSSSPVGVVRHDEDVEVLPSLHSPPAVCRASRIATNNVYTSSVIAGWSRYPDAHTVVLASSKAPMEGLAAAPLAGALGAPLMITSATGLPAVLSGTLQPHAVTTAYVVGTATSITSAVEDQLRSHGVSTVVRVGGSDRYGVAAAVARQLNRRGRDPILVSGTSLADAAAAAGPAAATGRPLLYVTRTGVPAATASALRALAIRRALVVGSTRTVSTTVAAGLARLGITRTYRLGSTDAATTAAAVATAYSRQISSARVSVVPAAGGLWAVVAAGQARLTLFSQGAGLPTATTRWLNRHRRGRMVLASAPTRAPTAVLRALLVASA